MTQTLRTALALLLALLAVCSAARAWQARIEATGADAAPLFELTASLSDRPALDKARLEDVLGNIRLTEVGRSEAFIYFTGSRHPLGTLTLAHVDLREPRVGGPATVGALLVLDIEGPCVRHAKIEKHFGPLALSSTPRGHSNDETMVWSRTLPDRTLNFGFPERDPDCLGTISLQFHVPWGNAKG
jgi:hypothetical protein